MEKAEIREKALTLVLKIEYITHRSVRLRAIEAALTAAHENLVEEKRELEGQLAEATDKGENLCCVLGNTMMREARLREALEAVVDMGYDDDPAVWKKAVAALEGE